MKPNAHIAGSEASRLTLLYGAVFVEIGIAMPFMPIWLNAIDLDASLIGMMVAIPILVRIVTTAPLMSLVDRGLQPRRLLIAGSLGVAVTNALMPGAVGFGWPLLALLIALNAVAGAPLVPSIDFLTLRAARGADGIDYARVRLGGSVGFLAANLVGGALLGIFGERLAIPLLLTGLALIAAAVAAVATENAESPNRSRREGPRTRLPAVLWLSIAAAAAVQASHAAVYAFGSITWSREGISGSWIGALWATGVAAEIALFAVIGRLPAPWRSPFRLLGIGASAAILRAIGLAYGGHALPTLIVLQSLHALTFGATHFGAMQAVSRFAPEAARGRAQGTASATNALASASATLLCGLAYERLGSSTTFLMMAPIALIGLALVGLAARNARRENTLSSP